METIKQRKKQELIKSFNLFVKLFTAYLEKQQAVYDEWQEEKHKRDKNGRFAKSGSSTTQQKTYKEMCGTPYKEYSGKPKEAIEHLLKMKNGYVPNAAYKDGIGNIDFLWGEKYGKNTKGYGLAHIIEERKIQGLDGIDLIQKIPEIIEKGEIGKGRQDRKTITYKDNMLVIAKSDSNSWIITEYMLYDKMDENTRNKAKELKEKANQERKIKYGR